MSFIKLSHTLLLLCLLLVACGGGGGGSGNPTDDEPELSAEEARDEAFDLENFRDTFPYNFDSPYASFLTACSTPRTFEDVCELADLPLLIEESPVVSIDDIMDRVVVSHSWMGLRFRQALETMPPEILQLFQSLTVIVIDSDVRPSFYIYPLSVMFIDPAYLWLTNQEKATIAGDDDFRVGFSEELPYLFLTRYVIGNNFAYDYYSLDDFEERTINDLRLELASLLLHELAHANDYFPASEIPYLSQNQSIYSAFESLESRNVNRQLQAVYPLDSSMLFDIAGVYADGETSTPSLRRLEPGEVGDLLENNGANDWYNYSDPAEDVAMLFEEAMMKYLFDVDRDVAVTTNPEDISCATVIVGWGQRGRIGDSEVKQRAQFVLEQVYLGASFSMFFQSLPAPTDMYEDVSWCTNLFL